MFSGGLRNAFRDPRNAKRALKSLGAEKISGLLRNASQENGIYTHPIDLSCCQKFEKIHRPEAEILAHEIGKYEKVTVNWIPLYACAKLFTEMTGLSFRRILCNKEIFFLLIILRVTRKVTKTNLGEFYCSHLH